MGNKQNSLKIKIYRNFIRKNTENNFQLRRGVYKNKKEIKSRKIIK
jgi:hypothetical protein